LSQGFGFILARPADGLAIPPFDLEKAATATLLVLILYMYQLSPKLRQLKGSKGAAL